MAKNTKATAEQPELQDQTDDDEVGSVIEFSEDISDAEKPDPLPLGTYVATIMDVSRGRGKDSNRPYVMIKWEIPADNIAADYVEKWQVDKKVLQSIHMIAEDTPTSRFAARRLCEALGAPMGRSINFAEWKGLEARLEIKYGKDLEGLDREEVKRVTKL